MSKKIISNVFLLLVLASVGFAGFQKISLPGEGFVFTDFQEMTMSEFANFLAEKALEKKGMYFVHITSADCKINLDTFRDFASSTNYVTVSDYSIKETSGKSQTTFYPGYYVFSVKAGEGESVSISGRVLMSESTSLPGEECVSEYQGVRADEWAGFGEKNAGILYHASNLVYPEDQGEECGDIVAWWGAAWALDGMTVDNFGCGVKGGVPMPRVYYRVAQDILGLEPKDCSGWFDHDGNIDETTNWMKGSKRYDSYHILKYNDTAVYYDRVKTSLSYYTYYATFRPKVDKGTETNPRCYDGGIQRFWWIVDYLYCVKGSKCMQSEGSKFVWPCSAQSGYGTCCHGEVLYSDGKPHCCPSGYSKIRDFGNGKVLCFKS